MGELVFEFDKSKAIETIIYIAQNSRNPTFHSITHLLYFADKTSLEKYGRFICGDDYFAVEHGPVPTRTYDLLKASAITDEYGFVADGHKVIPQREPDLDWLSDSDIECLKETIDLYGDYPFWKLREDSHDDAYEEAWQARGASGSSRMRIESIVKLLGDSKELLHYLANKNST